ncbi:MAG TPA: protein kinase [Bryobacteraceae bacterium]|nr:protein kinase [Bryobacteraceae bacterium]
MPVSPGDKLGPYEIVSQIGAGGMGEVYRARDTRLGRDVALKILPAELANDTSRRQRFELEARAVAALNHPNIVAVYDVGPGYIVSELVDGEPLRGGELGPRKTIEIATQIASGLAAAHDAGIVHRDLKPDNILLTRDGRPKILDFGLAKVQAKSAATGDQTVTARTEAGVVMGTPGYMSPEQVRGLATDHRSDIFSFGVILHELLTGKRVFHGETSVETMVAILKREAPELPETVPAGLRQTVAHCLEKDPVNRFQSVKDLAFALQSLSGSAITKSSLETSAAPPKHRSRWLFAFAATAALMGGVILGAYVAAPPIDLGKQHHRLIVSRTAHFAAPRWAPDGKSFAYNDFRQVMIQSLNATTPAPIFRGSDVPLPFYSPDGSRVYITDGGNGRSVWTASTAGGEPQLLLKELGGFFALDGAAVTPDGQTLVVTKGASNDTAALYLYLSSPPGAPPQPIPGGFSLPSSSRIRLRFSHDGKKLLALTAGARRAEDAQMWILPWPPGSVPARRIHREVRLDNLQSCADWLLDNRHLIVAAGSRDSATRFLVIDTESDASYPLTPDNVWVSSPAVGPDGRILYSHVMDAKDLVQFPIDGSAPKDLLATDWMEYFGAWSRSGGEFVFVSDRGGEQGLWVSSADGSWERRVVAPRDLGGQGAGAEFRSPEFSPDGKRIVYIGGRRAWVSPVSGGSPTPVTPDGDIAITPTWSADGLWIAYRVGTLLKKVRVGNPAAPVVISETGAVPAVWSPDGKWITLGVNDGIGIVSPDGAQKRTLIQRPFGNITSSIGWSRDGAVLYLLNKVEDHYRLSAVDVARGNERVIQDYPASGFDFAENFLAAGRLYPSGDGKSLLTTRNAIGSSVWMMEGVEPPLPLWRRLLRR